MNAVTEPRQRDRAASTAQEVQAALEQKQYLTFMLGGETFAIGILHVKEIIGYGGLTEVPMMPECVRGVINLRGAVVPVMDLSARFGKASTAITRRTCIVIVEVAANGESQDMGVVVDAVNAVMDIPSSDIEPAPAFGARIRTDFIEGMAKINSKFVILLNVDQVLSTDELAVIASAGDLAASLPAASATSSNQGEKSEGRS